jgi:hypothetical protein
LAANKNILDFQMRLFKSNMCSVVTVYSRCQLLKVREELIYGFEQIVGRFWQHVIGYVGGMKVLGQTIEDPQMQSVISDNNLQPQVLNIKQNRPSFDFHISLL